MEMKRNPFKIGPDGNLVLNDSECLENVRINRREETSAIVRVR